MTHIEGRVVINAPVERVWEYLEQIENLTKVDPRIASIQRKTDGPRRVGFVSESTVKVGPWPIKTRNELIVHVPRQAVAWRATSMFAGEMTGVYRFTPEDQGTEFVYAIFYTLPLGPLGVLANWLFGKRVLEKHHKTTLENVKTLVEGLR